MPLNVFLAPCCSVNKCHIFHTVLLHDKTVKMRWIILSSPSNAEFHCSGHIVFSLPGCKQLLSMFV